MTKFKPSILYHSTRKNAAKRGIPFELTSEEFRTLWGDAAGVCSVTGRPLDLTGAERAEFRRNPWAPSIDRRDSLQPYRLDNCRIVCVAANIAMNEWGVDVLRAVAHGLFGSNPSQDLSRYGSGLLRGIYARMYKGAHRYTVRISVNGELRGFGTFRDYELAVKRLGEARAFVDSAVGLAVGKIDIPKNLRRTVYKTTA